MLADIISSIVRFGGRPYEVGGYVRDSLLGLQAKDLDIEVFGLSADSLYELLSEFGQVNRVGVSFGVMKLNMADGTEVDFTLPRRETKCGPGHKGFDVELDPSMTISIAAARRDYTINAIYRCAASGALDDPYKGLVDLRGRCLRATSSQFAEDPLRVLRGMQFAARFNLVADQRTTELCLSLRGEYPTLAIERIWNEWLKWATRGAVPSKGLRFLAETDWLTLYPQLEALRGCPQDPQWHPEGDVWIHTLHVCDAAAQIAARDHLGSDERAILLFAALCHDLGKATTTAFVDGHWRAHGHCEAGVELSRQFLSSIGCPEAIIEFVEPLVAEHLVHARQEITARSVRRLASRLSPASIEQLIRLIEADMGGRPPLPPGLPSTVQVLAEMAQELQVEQGQPAPLILGRHLLALGKQPGPWFGPVLAACFEAQLDGHFNSEGEGVEYLKDLLNRHG
ncbi:MAG: polynucleotide adenylyltransferase [Pirellula sp.]|nr:polynucleotide adenylyltransferase [Pirellula sp.]